MATHKKVQALPFFSEWSGHPIKDLATALSAIKTTRPAKSIVYLAGDSSLDNKAWVPSSGPGGEPLPEEVPSIYNSFLDPPVPKPDVAYWLNHYLGERATCLNTAIEATLLRQRYGRLLPQDTFIRDNIRADDALIVSVAANDIAMSPNIATILHMLKIAWLTPRSSIENGTAWGLGYFKRLFGDRTQDYISRLVATQKPRAIIVCMIYFPYEGKQSGWAELQLKLLGYNSNPGQLQAAIRTIFRQATSEIRIDGTEVIPCAFYEVLDGKHEEDYVERAEPSVEGGRKIGEKLHGLLDGLLMGEGVKDQRTDD